MKDRSNIVIIGPLGAGKSTIGRHLARALDRDFYDIDREVEERTGVDLGWIFDVEGEESFRDRETAVLKELLKMKNIVIATGGGILTREENRQLLKDKGLVIYLNAPLPRLIERTGRNQYNRPMLRNTKLQDKVVELYEERTPHYQEAADKMFVTTRRPVQVVVKQILKYLNEIEALRIED